ncbi:MAG: hypothetical protein IT211_10130 [Armatimonadetes bacterium]|nr:hypothetical protein [Armatimonadota bacterium]
MRRIIVAIAWLCLSGYPLMGQHLSPLFGVLASQSPLQRPEPFQQLQDELPDYLKDIEPGLRMPFINDQLKEFEAKLSNAINGITATAIGNTLQITNASGGIIIELTSTYITINSISLGTTISSSGLKALLWRIVSHIDDPILKQYASIIRDAPLDSINKLLTASSITLHSNTPIFMDAPSMAVSISTGLKNLSEKIIQAMHIAGNEYAEIVAQASDYFINGDIGLSLTSGEGAFAGGVFIGIKKQGFSLGGFTNLIGSSIDKDKNPGNAQIGLRTTIPTHANGSIDFFCSSYTHVL